MFSLSMSPTADIVNWVTSADGCVHTSHRQHRGNTTRRDCRQLVANSVHSTHRRLASASCIGLNYFAVNNVKLQQKSYGLIGLITEPVFVHSWNDNNTANTCIANGNLYGCTNLGNRVSCLMQKNTGIHSLMLTADRLNS